MCHIMYVYAREFIHLYDEEQTNGRHDKLKKGDIIEGYTHKSVWYVPGDHNVLVFG